ncbi:MAG: ABC transporter ATP-binding protein [Acidimicrobiales bacterium]
MAGWMQGGVSADERLDLAGTKAVLRRALRLVSPYRRRGVQAIALLILWTGTTIAGPLLVRSAIDDGIRPKDGSHLALAVGGYLAAAVLGYVFYRGSIATLAWVGENTLRDLRRRVFDKLLRQSLAYYDRNKAGILVSRMTSDVDSLSELVQFGLLMFTAAFLQLVGTVIVLTFLSWQLMLCCLAAIPLVGLASIKFQKDSNKAYLAVRDNIGSTLSALQEGISGVRLVQAFGRESLQAQQFSETNEDLYRSHMNSVRVAAWYLPIIEFASTATTALTIGVGGYLSHQGRLTIGTVVAFILLLQGLFEPVQQLSQLFNLVQSATASLDKLFGLLDEEIDLVEPVNPVAFPPSGAIEVEGLGFTYEGSSEPVLSGIDLTIADGERIALVGPTGAGKSTLAKIIARLYDPTVGTIRFGGVDLRDGSVAELRRRILVVPQEGYLFDGSIADNIRIASPSVGDDEVRQALERIGIWERIEALPDGLATEVQERGSRLSAGERQLVSLARAALVDPAVLVLDEATSSLDPGTERIVEAALERLMSGRTVIAIAHRLTTAARCDRVAVVAEGSIAEIGPHAELVEQGGHYAALFGAWRSGLGTPSGN